MKERTPRTERTMSMIQSMSIALEIKTKKTRDCEKNTKISFKNRNKIKQEIFFSFKNFLYVYFQHDRSFLSVFLE